MQVDPTVQFVNVRGVRLAYRSCGFDTSKPAMVLLHGLAESSAFFWRPLVQEFQEQYQIVAFDLLGHGDSDHPTDGYEIENQALLIVEALEALGLSNTYMIGHSLGGVIAARIAIEYPEIVNKLILYDSPLSDKPQNNIRNFMQKVPDTALLLLLSFLLPKKLARITASLVPIRLALKLTLWRWRVPYRRDLLNDEFIEHSMRNSSYALMECVRSAYMHHNIMQDLHRLQQPTCFIVGDSDMLLPISVARRTVRHIPKGELAIIQSAGHVSLIDQPQQFNHALHQFLETTH